MFKSRKTSGTAGGTMKRKVVSRGTGVAGRMRDRSGTRREYAGKW